MSEQLSLVDQVRVEPRRDGRLVGELTDRPLGYAFGGQLMGQAVMALQRDHPSGRLASLHTSFLSPATTSDPMTYHHEVLRSGRTYSWHRVTGTQTGRLVLEASLCLSREPLARHDESADPIHPPEPADGRGLQADTDDWFDSRLGSLDISAVYLDGPLPERVARGDDSPEHEVWLRSSTARGASALERAACMAVLSDVNLLACALGVLGRDGSGPERTVTLTHFMQFHADPMETDDWLQYRQTCDVASGPDLVASGHMTSTSGRRIASTRQHGRLLGLR